MLLARTEICWQIVIYRADHVRDVVQMLRQAVALVVNAVVVDRGAPWLAVPYGDRTGSLRLDYDLSHGLANHFRNAPSRPSGGLAQRLKLLFGQVDLDLLHMRQFKGYK